MSSTETFDVFTRTWWKDNPSWPDGLEPEAGEKTYLARDLSEEEARAMCREWNATHEPGRHSLKAEYERSAHQVREERLAALGFEEVTPEQRKKNLALNVALRDWPKPDDDT